jgi:hypothetical protein
MLASTVLVVLLPASVQTEGPWSAPVPLAGCSGAGTPAVLFPKDSYQQATGTGAIVWSAPSHCPERPGAGPADAGAAGGSPIRASGAGARVSAIATGSDLPGEAFVPLTATGRALGLTGPIVAAEAPHGRILLTGAGPDGRLLVSEGQATGPFGSPLATAGAATPLALTSAYLGDVALASPRGVGRNVVSSPIELRIHRYYQSSFLGPVSVSPAPSRSVEGLTLAMDYRSDALAVWERAGSIYAREMPGSSRSSRSVQRVAAAAPHARIVAVLSDDNRAILAWADTRAGVTSVYAELTGPGVRFGVPRLLERFPDPDGSPPPRGAIQLVRLASESVMLAWSGASAGHWVVHTAAVDLNGVRSIATISAPSQNALLADLATGADGEAFALWSEPEPPGARAGPQDRTLLVARGIDAYPGRTIFSAPETIAPAGSSGTTGEAAIAVDPDSDRVIAAWRTPASGIDYSLRSVVGG